MKGLLKLVVVFVIGVLVGYVLAPTIDKVVKKQNVVTNEKVDDLKAKANEKAEDYIEKE